MQILPACSHVTRGHPLSHACNASYYLICNLCTILLSSYMLHIIHYVLLSSIQCCISLQHRRPYIHYPFVYGCSNAALCAVQLNVIIGHVACHVYVVMITVCCVGMLQSQWRTLRSHHQLTLITCAIAYVVEINVTRQMWFVHTRCRLCCRPHSTRVTVFSPSGSCMVCV